LPWLAAGGALVVYLLTLNHWLSLNRWTSADFWNSSHNSLAIVANTAGWNWQPEVVRPAYYAVTLPLRWLPDRWVPLSLNVFSLACAVATLALLTRSVSLLPYDRTREQRDRERHPFALLTVPGAWIPPILSAAVCGLQLTFWEHATAASYEMFDLLIFAFVVYSLLAYRIDEREGRLFLSALVYGVAMTNNFAMVAFFPAFMAALVWIRGFSFFNLRFMGRMALCGLGGLLLILLLPTLAALSNTQPLGFWEALQTNLLATKTALLALPPKTVGILGLFSLVPVLLLSIRWASSFGDTSRLGLLVATWMFHLVHGAFLAACLWVAFDPPVSPRQNGSGYPFLPFYFLGAMSVGYFCGYFLLVFSLVEARGRRTPGFDQFASRFFPALVIAVLVLAPAALTYRNLPQIRLTNGPLLEQFAAATAEKLPASGVLLSDDPRRTILMRAWLARSGRQDDFLLLDTQSLAWPGYRRHLKEMYPLRWTEPVTQDSKQPLGDLELLVLVSKLSQATDLYYLHPSFGYYFEYFHDVPKGLVHQLRPFPAGALVPPSLTAEVIGENEAFWTKVEHELLPPVLKAVTPRSPDNKAHLLDRLLEKARLKAAPNEPAVAVGRLYSRAFNCWGVELQKSGDFEKAAARFALAKQLNSENVVAQLNLEYNQQHRAGQTGPLKLPEYLKEQFMDRMLSDHGPYDEPGLTAAQATMFVQGRLFRQAAEGFERVRTLSPHDLASRMWLAQFHLMAAHTNEVLAAIKEIRDAPDRFVLTRTNQVDLLTLEVSARFAARDAEGAARMLEAELKRYPNEIYLLSSALRIYMQQGRVTNALAVVNRQLQIAPDDASALISKSYLCINDNAFDEAVRTLDHLLTLQPTNYPALLNRAIAYLRSERLDEAKQDYETLQQALPKAYPVYFGLAEIAYRRHETNAAIQHYETYLGNAATNSAEAQFVEKRLKELKGVSP
jgi:tetratricopeptide (TPR) repeat protein